MFEIQALTDASFSACLVFYVAVSFDVSSAMILTTQGDAMQPIKVGDRVVFEAPLSNGGHVRWTSVVVKLDDGIASVRHPLRARTFPFTPVPANALYRYDVETLRKGRVGVDRGTALPSVQQVSR